MTYRCFVCGSQEIKETHENRFGRKMRYQSHFGKRQYCSRECMIIALYKRQLFIGIFALIFFAAFGSLTIYIFIRYLQDMIFLPIIVIIVAFIVAFMILLQGIRGRRLKEEREFRNQL